jgi:tetratricopeptide (TPR) repeat protein
MPFVLAVDARGTSSRAHPNSLHTVKELSMRASFIIPLFAITVATNASAQDLTARDKWADSARREIEAASVEGSTERLHAARALIERALTAFPNDPLLLHYQGYSLYREAGLMQGMKREEKEIRRVLEAADAVLERSAKKLDLAETHALRSSVIGQQIGSNPLRGMTLGPRASSAMDRAMELAPDNPRVWLMRGISAMFTPGMFGGGQGRADEYLNKAIALFASDKPAPPAPAWGHADAWIWLGQLRQQQGRIADARKAYTTALEIQPGNGWVQYVLLPALDRAGR